LYEGSNAGSGGRGGSIRSGILELFDNPKIGIDYRLKIYKNLSVNINYSYWLFGSMINDLYGLTKNYIVKFKDYKFVVPMRNRIFRYDMYSHNISVGLSLKLYK
jgi:hypothetical protein